MVRKRSKEERVRRIKGGENYSPPPNVGFLGIELCLFKCGDGLFKLGNGVGDGVEQGEILGHGNTSFLQAG